jgi:TatD DNase family protein
MARVIDTHAHLNDEPLCLKLDTILADARAAGVAACIIPGYNQSCWQQARGIAAQHHDVYVAAGVHPIFAHPGAAAELEAEIQRGGLVAVGEIGLDYAVAEVDHVLQQEAFEQQLALAVAHDLPVVLHCRRAHDDLLRILRGVARVRGVMHSCSCSHEQVKPFLDLGLSVSFSGVVTRRSAKKVKKLAHNVPLECMIAETDSPYIGTQRHPVPNAVPADVLEVVQALALLRDTDVDEMAALTTRNAERLFGFGVRT